MTTQTDWLVAAARSSGIIAVVTIENVEHAVPMARALVAGGVPLIEITLRTPSALPAIAAIARAVPEALVGAGTVLAAADLAAAQAAGARFALSPGATPAVLAAGAASAIPFVPGTATASEILAAREAGYRFVKLFPAEQLGGPATLKALSAPIADMIFCPTGGIDAARAPAWRSLPCVACVGGSWLTPAALLAAGDWAGITALARASSG